jgi:ssDNA thymidine ADP-ribosyltransferase, DarT
VEFRDKPEHLGTIDWSIVQNVRRCLSPDYKARKAAELLVYPKVETQCIARIVTRSERARQQILRSLKKPHAPVEVDRSRYFT